MKTSTRYRTINRTLKNNNLTNVSNVSNISNINQNLIDITKLDNKFVPKPPKKDFIHLDIPVTNLIKTIYKYIDKTSEDSIDLTKELLILAETIIRFININSTNIRSDYIKVFKNGCQEYKNKSYSEDPINIAVSYVLNALNNINYFNRVVKDDHKDKDKKSNFPSIL